jgi:DNA polymerase III epsilon subunit-like protein
MQNFNPEELFYNSVVVDLETTGLYAGESQILQLCAIKPTLKGPMVFNRYIYAEENPAYWVNRIDPENLKNCPTEREVLQEFWAFVQDRDLLSPTTQALKCTFWRKDRNSTSSRTGTMPTFALWRHFQTSFLLAGKSFLWLSVGALV